MKKANIIFSTISLLSVIGGALAFKSQHRFNGVLLCYTTLGDGNKYAAIVATRYTFSNPTGTLFCTIPGPAVTYRLSKVAVAF
ncbi:hypothetical protein [Chitinophaga sancti]|uniref:Uncharacterized protein n=1 Tax=Chitinophaga sancti TaxID=1004 RepID=A0A1K1T3J6_9BACT|nr:hypothetical protein [Chitinophaga sancti]WQD59549.1 hypothetical protein U0033_16775 [Chitinophaga sancti]WQG88317.1 hypothetical protein SR876_25690 [Chitinophaga sancti]SFW90629.1 hypothetical protein SAMN05661012_06645 [Chitinophaga sancti]